MHDDRPSRTAFRVAMRRAAHQLLDDPVVFRDPVALEIIGPEQAAAIRSNPRAYDRGQGSRALRAILAVRSRVAEETLADAVTRGVRQYVVLGAGLDTFAYRNPHAAAGLRVFEVDHPATQRWKRGALARFGIAIPPSVTFVPVNFEQQVAATELLRAGFDPRVPTFFSWLGVTMYLAPETVLSTLGWIAQVTHAGGGIVFDYALAASELDVFHRIIFALVARRVKRVGEPWIGRFVPAQLAAEMRRLGFDEIDDLSGAALNARYFAGRADRLKVSGLAHLMRARTTQG